MIHRHKSIFSMNSHEQAKEIERIQKIDGHHQFSLQDYQETQVKLIPDEKIARAQFKPDPFLPNSYRAHPVTLRAVRKEIFLAATSLDELEEKFHCRGCLQELDLQFWHFCPYCESSIKILS